MLDFAAILASVERDAAIRDARDRKGPPPLSAFAFVAEARQAPERHAAYAAYAAQTRLQSVADDAPPPLTTIDTLRGAIVAARDTKRLRDLRRLAARALHPDRGGDGAELAECNALIDAALRTSRRRT